MVIIIDIMKCNSPNSPLENMVFVSPFSVYVYRRKVVYLDGSMNNVLEIEFYYKNKKGGICSESISKGEQNDKFFD